MCACVRVFFGYEEMTPMLPLVGMVVWLHRRGGLILYVILETATPRIRGLLKTTATSVDKPTRTYVPHGQASWFPRGGLKRPVHLKN